MAEIHGRHAAPDPYLNDLGEQLALSLAMRQHGAILHVATAPDMETRAALFNDGFQTAHAWDQVENPETDDAVDRVEAMVEAAPEPIPFTWEGEVVAVLLLAPGWGFHRPHMTLTAEGRGQLIATRREA